MVADVRGAIGHRSGFRRLTRAFNRAQRDAHLRLSVGRGELLDRLTLAIAAEEVHRAVDAGGIALQHLLDQAHRFEVVAPIERRAQTQAGQDVGHRHQRGGLLLVLAPDRIFRRHPVIAQVLLDRLVKRRQAQPVFARALQQANDVGGVGGRWQRRQRQTRFAPRHRGVGREPRVRATRISSARRRRFSMSASFRMLGQAHSSPMLRGATD